jgi:hypothetical protein
MVASGTGGRTIRERPFTGYDAADDRSARQRGIARVTLQRIEVRMPWPRTRGWRPGEPITVEVDGATITGRLRGVMRDAVPGSDDATVTIEPLRTIAASEDDDPTLDLSAAG